MEREVRRQLPTKDRLEISQHGITFTLLACWCVCFLFSCNLVSSFREGLANTVQKGNVLVFFKVECNLVGNQTTILHATRACFNYTEQTKQIFFSLPLCQEAFQAHWQLPLRRPATADTGTYLCSRAPRAAGTFPPVEQTQKHIAKFVQASSQGKHLQVRARPSAYILWD